MNERMSTAPIEKRPTIASPDYFSQRDSDATLNETQTAFFTLLPDKKLKVDYAKIIALPEYAACKEAFRKGAAKFSSTETEQLETFVSEWLKSFFKKTSTTMWRSSMYGTDIAAEALASLARKLGFSAHVERPYGDGEQDFAVVVGSRTV
jgi:hypothetical protein